MEEYKYKLKKRKTTRHITEDREISSDDDSEPDSKQDFNETSEQFTNGILIHMNVFWLFLANTLNSSIVKLHILYHKNVQELCQDYIENLGFVSTEKERERAPANL